MQGDLSLSYGFRPPFLLADDVFPWFMYVVITLENAAHDTPNKVAVLDTYAQLNAHQKSVLFENLTSLKFCSTFIRTVIKHSL
jgi:hypothetical protein